MATGHIEERVAALEAEIVRFEEAVEPGVDIASAVVGGDRRWVRQ